MPIFEYSCEPCNYTFDKLVVGREREVRCPRCHGEVKKLMSTFAVPARLSCKDIGERPRTMCTKC